jgi:hypothetical protein
MTVYKSGAVLKPSCPQNVNMFKKTKSVAWVRERTIPTERPPLVCEVSANFCVYRVPHGQRNGSLRPYSPLPRPVNLFKHSQILNLFYRSPYRKKTPSRFCLPNKSSLKHSSLVPQAFSVFSIIWSLGGGETINVYLTFMCSFNAPYLTKCQVYHLSLRVKRYGKIKTLA